MGGQVAQVLGQRRSRLVRALLKAMSLLGEQVLPEGDHLRAADGDAKPECRCPQCRRMPPCPRREYTLTALMVHMTLDVHPRRPALKRRVVPSYTDRDTWE